MQLEPKMKDSLSERLRLLGVQLGSEDLKPTRARFPIQEVMEGRDWDTPLGPAFLTERIYPWNGQHGNRPLRLPGSYGLIEKWAESWDLHEVSPETIAFLDTETTGLAGGTGTFAFLIGIGRFEPDGFHLLQFFLRDLSEEPGMLAAIESFLTPCKVLVTFNGKSFDLPLVHTRYLNNGWEQPWHPEVHLDLLPLARRIWRDRLPSRTLGSLETQILEVEREDQEVPGWLVPQMYHDYLRTGDARPLEGVFYHNQIDILSMVGLMDHMAELLTDPWENDGLHRLEYSTLARLMEDLDDAEGAMVLYEKGLRRNLPQEVRGNAVRRYSFLLKRRGEFTRALELWEQEAHSGEIYAHIEIAKYYEHRAGDFRQALDWTETALASLDDSSYPSLARAQWEGELLHRQARLVRKLGRSDGLKS